MNISKIVTAISSLLFFMIGADKFMNFLEPPCSLMSSISSNVWSVLGIIQIAGGILIWFPKIRKPAAGFFMLFFLFFTGVHIGKGTYDIGGSIFMAALMGLLLWNPSFMRGKSK